MPLVTAPSASAPERPRHSAVSIALPAIAALAPRFATAATYLAAWIVPQQMPPGLVKGLFIGMILEFLLIHSYVFLNLAAGKANGPSLFMTGKLKLEGDLMLAQRMTSFFRIPTVKED